MIERLLAFLKELPTAQRPIDRKDDPRIAAAALMIHLIDADGQRAGEEGARLRSVLSESYGISGQELEDLLAAGEAADREAVDLYGFTSVLKRHLDEDSRAEFIGLMWDVAYADGERNELEDNLVWRVAELIGVDSRERIAQRQRVERQAHGRTGGREED